MTPAVRFLRRMLLLPVDAAAETRASRLAETTVARDSASRALTNACARLAVRGVEIHALSAGVIERNEEAKEN